MDISEPDISVVLPHYGASGPTRALVGQLLAQDDPPTFEIIVVDDCSPSPFPTGAGWAVARRSVNGGFGSAVNTGAKVASGRTLVILNSDSEVPSNFLQRCRAEATSHPDRVLGPRIVEGGVPKVTAWRWPRVSGLVAEWLEPLARYHQRPLLNTFWGADTRAHNSLKPVEVDWVVGACLVLPRSAFANLGGFDEGFYMNCEEVDLQRRLTGQGVRSLYVPGLTVVHEGGGSSDPERKSGWLVDARFRYHAKWGGAGRLLFGLTSASVVNMVWNFCRRATGREVRPVERFRHQLGLVLHGWRHRKMSTPR